MNRPLRFAPDGSLVLRPERVYRLLLVVNGETSAEDLEDALVAAGFDREALCSSTPRDWPRDRPADWPEEPSVDTAVNECLVRLSGRFAGASYAFTRDARIADSAATYSIVSGWDYAPSLTEGSAPAPIRTGGAPPAPAPDHRGTAMFVTAAALLGLGVWTSMRGERRMERETARMRAAIERDEREAVRARAADLVREGKTADEAAAIAHMEINAEGARFEALEEAG
jgi:hypothetical protein